MRIGIRIASTAGAAILLAGQPSQNSLTVAQRTAIEKAVQEVHAQTLRSAEQLDLDKAISTMLDTDKGSFIRDGELLLTRQDAYDVFKKAYDGLQKQEIKVGRQNVMVLSPDVAILVGEGRSTATTKDGLTFRANHAYTVVFVLRDNEWRVLHAHQSVPNRR